MKKLSLSLAFILLLCFLSINIAQARSGCCSHHGGVCGCGCCDGTDLSETCAPYYPQCNSAPAIEERPAAVVPIPEEKTDSVQVQTAKLDAVSSSITENKQEPNDSHNLNDTIATSSEIQTPTPTVLDVNSVENKENSTTQSAKSQGAELGGKIFGVLALGGILYFFRGKA